MAYNDNGGGIYDIRPDENKRKLLDPTRDEMLAYLNSQLVEMDEFDKEGAIYWFANHYHSGQWSNLYSVLSTSQYRPGRMESGPSGLTMEYLYDLLEVRFAAK